MPCVFVRVAIHTHTHTHIRMHTQVFMKHGTEPLDPRMANMLVNKGQV